MTAPEIEPGPVTRCRTCGMTIEGRQQPTAARAWHGRPVLWVDSTGRSKVTGWSDGHYHEPPEETAP